MVPGNSPCYLGLPEWDCCGTQGLLESPQEADSMRPTSKSESTVNGDDKTTKPMAKKQKVSLQLRRDKQQRSWSIFIPKNTSRSTSWAVCVYKQWVEQCNKRMDVAYPTDLKLSLVCECLQWFVSEARLGDGTEYPPPRPCTNCSVVFFDTQEKNRWTQSTFK